MIPILFDQNEKEFTSGGLGFLAECKSCQVSEERNGIFECQFVYPITGSKYDLIQERMIILATHDDTGIPQPFDIYARSAPIDGLVTFYAHHISYRLSNGVVMPFTAESCADAMAKIQANLITDTDDDFTFWTDKTTSGDYAKTVPSICRTTLGGEEGSILDVYGKGDYMFDKFAVKLYASRGSDTNVEIRYGKNLKNIEHKIDRNNAYNAIVPFWINEETGTLVTLPEGFVSYDDGTAYIVAIPFSMNEYFETQPTEAELRTQAQNLLDGSDAWVPDEGFSVDFVQLWQTEEYEQYAPLQRVNLCDTVRVYYPELGVNAVREKVVKTVYNTLLDRYDEITLNELPTTLSGMTQQQINESMENTVSPEGLRAQINLAIQLVRGDLGGYIAIQADSDGLNECIYVMDSARKESALNVIRIGANGISRSTNGIDGPYISIISMTTGALRGDLTGNVTGNVTGDLVGDVTGNITGNVAGNVTGDVTGNVTGNLTGNVTGNVTAQILEILLSGSALGQILGFVVGSENVLGVKATNPFILADGAGALGYRYGGSTGDGSYGAPHYFSGNVVIDGDITVTGTINNGGA